MLNCIFAFFHIIYLRYEFNVHLFLSEIKCFINPKINLLVQKSVLLHHFMKQKKKIFKGLELRLICGKK